LALLLRILAGFAANLNAETGYREFFVCFLSLFRQIWNNFINKATNTSFHILSNSLIIISLDAIDL
jgi:hypothetical protein